MKARKTLTAVLAFMFLAVPGLVLAGGEPGLQTPHLEIDVSQLGEPCTYWAPDQQGVSQLHSGAETQVVVNDSDAVTVHRACTDQIISSKEPCTPTLMPLDCFLRGEHYIEFQAISPAGGCIWFTVKGLRGAAASVRIASSTRALQYLSTDEVPGQMDQICSLNANQRVKMRLMMCPDLNRDHVISLFDDVMGTAFFIGKDEGHPDWNSLADHNQDGQVDLFHDLFPAMFRYGLECDDFDY